jgi:hypothetical protein
MKTYGKAITAAVGTLLGALGAAMADGDITRPECIVAAGAALVVGGAAVYAPYRPTE